MNRNAENNRQEHSMSYRSWVIPGALCALVCVLFWWVGRGR